MNRTSIKIISRVFLAVLLSCTMFTANAQDSLLAPGEKKPFTDGVDITGSIGLNHFWGDIRHYDYWPVWSNENENQLGYGLALHKELFHFLGVGIKGNAGKLQGTQRNHGNLNIFFNTNMYEGSLDLTVDIINLINLKAVNPNKKFAALITLGHGIMHFESEVYRKSDLGINTYVDQRHLGRSGKTNEAVTSYGLWLRYKIKDNWHIGLETSLRNVWNDKLDGWYSEGSARDKYSYSTLTFSYIFPNRLRRKEEEPEPPKDTVVAEVVPEPVEEVVEEVVEVIDTVVSVPVAEPEVIEPEVIEPEVIEPEVIEPEVVKPEIVEAPPVEKLNFKDNVIYFELNSRDLSDPLDKQIKSVADKLKANPRVRIKLVGFADLSGGAQQNQWISLNRAKEVRSSLVQKYKISVDRIEVEGKGTEGARQELDPGNRRVDVVQID